jgi:hypothetical protein
MQGQYPQGPWGQQTTGWQQYYQQTQPAYPPPPGRPPETRGLGDARRKVQAAISVRRGSDRKLSAAWVVVPLVVMFALSAIGFSIIIADLLDTISEDGEIGVDLYTSDAMRSAYVFIILGSVFHLLAFGALIYLLLDRMNKHIDRERGLREALTEYVSTAAEAHGSRSIVASEAYTMEYAHRSALVSGKKMSPGMFALAFWLVTAVTIPVMIVEVYTDLLGDISAYAGIAGISLVARLAEIIVVLYLLNALGRHNYDHAVQWDNFVHGALYGLYKVGTPVMTPYAPRTPEERSFALYLILSIFTAGLFMYYWWYTAIKDPNEHYKQQWRVEDAISSAIAR